VQRLVNASVLPDLLAHAAPLLRPGGRCLFLKGARADAEIEAAHDAGWSFRLARHPSRLDGDGAILAIDDLARAPGLAARPSHRL
jgi:16S rRNA (guanine527-N7)-methyltransferase